MKLGREQRRTELAVYALTNVTRTSHEEVIIV